MYNLQLIRLTSTILSIVLLALGPISTSSPALVNGQSGKHNNESISTDNEANPIKNNQHQQALSSSSSSPPSLKVFEDIFTNELMDGVDMFFNQIDHLSDRLTISKLDYLSLTVRTHSLVYITTFTHRYDNYRELKKAGGPHADQELCIKQLEQLNKRVERQYEEKMDGQDINLYQLLDTYEWYATGTLLAGHEWPGSYNECLRIKINTTEGLVPTRYCSASFKRNKWPKQGKLNELLVMKAGVCLPKACDSIQYKNKYELIEKLVKFNARKVDERDANLNYLYCLPDDESTLRLWYHSPKTTAFVSALALWIAMLIYATIKYEKLTKTECDKSEQSTPQTQKRAIQIYKSLSLTYNIKSLFRISSPAKDDSRNSQVKEEKEEDKRVVDFSVLEGIKVIAMWYVITGHVLMIFTMIMRNGREMSLVDLNNMSFFSANLMPGLAVNAFFTITGILATYLLFKNSEPITLVTSPSKWFAFIVYRYIRIMPLYIVVIMYTKYLAKYTASGPFWDYGTSSLGARRQCEQEPWFWVLSFTANLKGPLEHCIPSAWYLANDFQFFIVTPIFLALLQKMPRFGRCVVLGAIFAGYISAMLNIAMSEVDLRPLATFMPHGFKTYVIFLSETYTMPHYRVPAYLCGLLIGYALYRYEQDMSSYLKQARYNEVNQAKYNDATNKKAIELKKPNWPKMLKKHGPTFCLSVVASCFGLPFLGDVLQSNKFYSKFLVACFMPTYHLLFAISTGLYVLLATTGYGSKPLNDFLSSPLWKPLSRLSLCVVLVNIEVISYFAQSSTSMLYMDFKTLTSLNLFSIVMSYLVATIVCVTFESPLRAMINHLVASVVKGLTTKQKSD